MAHTPQRRVVITGIGVVAPNGIGKEAFWYATSKGVSGIRPVRRFDAEHVPVSVAGEVHHFLPENYIERKLVQRTDRMTHFVFAAVHEALHDSHLNLAEENLHRVGAVIANTVGGVEYVLEQIHALHMRGPRAMSAYTAIAWLHVANVGQISVRYGIQGYCKTPVNDTAGGLNALGMAYTAIQRGAADVLITGGCEALLQPLILLVLAHGPHCATGNDPQAYRPFDRRARGLVLAEGAGICILEEYEHALRRGAPIYGEIVGYGQTNDIHGWHAPTSNGTQYARAMKLAMQEGHIQIHDLAYISLDGRAQPAADSAEVEALHLAFGPHAAALPASVPRTMLGHSYAAAGVLDTIAALMSLQHGLIPPTINCDEPDPRYVLRLVRDEARPVTGSSVLIGGRGLGGANVVLAVRKL